MPATQSILVLYTVHLRAIVLARNSSHGHLWSRPCDAAPPEHAPVPLQFWLLDQTVPCSWVCSLRSSYRSCLRLALLCLFLYLPVCSLGDLGVDDQADHLLAWSNDTSLARLHFVDLVPALLWREALAQQLLLLLHVVLARCPAHLMRQTFATHDVPSRGQELSCPRLTS